MRSVGLTLQWTIVPAVIMMAAGCMHLPEIQVAQPERIELDGRSIAVIGDLQQTAGFVRFVRRRENTAEQQRRLVADLQQHADDLGAVVIVGDLVFTARSRRDWAHFDDLMAPLADRLPLLPAIGNHDYPCWLVRWCRTANLAAGMQRRFPWIEPGRPYAVTAGNLSLLFLDSERELEAQARWLRTQLAAAANDSAGALVFFHRPPFSNSTESTAKGDPDVQRFVVPVVRESPLPTVVINGHIHGFEHSERDGVHFITTAGGGPRVAMPDTEPVDLYRGPVCTLAGNGATARPFNYLLLTPLAEVLRVEVRGFCAGDDAVRVLDSFTIGM